MPAEQEVADRLAVMNIHTADDERASWVTLLIALQGAEHESREWHRRTPEPRQGGPRSVNAPQYTLAVGIQYKSRSWNFMPQAQSRLFANTTICHLVEMTGMLGMFWKSLRTDKLEPPRGRQWLLFDFSSGYGAGTYGYIYG